MDRRYSYIMCTFEEDHATVVLKDLQINIGTVYTAQVPRQ